MTAAPKKPQLRPPLPPSDTDLIYAGKRPVEMMREELIACAVHFRDAHVEATLRTADAYRRMTKLEEAVSRDKIKKLDSWLKAHGRDVNRGDGAALYLDWQKWEETKS